MMIASTRFHKLSLLLTHVLTLIVELGYRGFLSHNSSKTLVVYFIMHKLLRILVSMNS